MSDRPRQLAKGTTMPVAPYLSEGALRDALTGDELLTPLVRTALDIAQAQHGGQGRADGAPYLEEHIYPIARDVAAWAQRRGWPAAEAERAVVVALLHDGLEDGPTLSEQELRDAFGTGVTADVRALTKAPKESPAERHGREEEYRTAVFTASLVARTVKVFDRLNNLACLHKRDAPNRERYIAETGELHLPLAREVDPELARAMEQTLHRLRAW